jgi:hypothetical protein
VPAARAPAPGTRPQLLQRGEAAELGGDPAVEPILRQAEHAEAPEAAQRRGIGAPQPGVGLEHDLLEGRRRRALKQRRRQLDGGGYEAAEEGERLEGAAIRAARRRLAWHRACKEGWRRRARSGAA